MANNKNQLYKILKANELLDRHTNEGDIINSQGVAAWWDIKLRLGHWGIRKAQKALFGSANSPQCFFQPHMDSHSTIKFRNSTIRKHMAEDAWFSSKVDKILDGDPWAKIFSVEPPRATLVNNADYSLQNIRVYRYTKKEITPMDVKIMLRGTVPILGTKYDFGQLLAIAATQIAGYPFADEKKFDFLDMGGSRKVCSVSVASVYTHWRHTLEKNGTALPRLFSKINQKGWIRSLGMSKAVAFIETFEEEKNKWPVERTYPANFSTTHSHFDNEFELVLHMQNGEVKYKKPRVV